MLDQPIGRMTIERQFDERVASYNSSQLRDWVRSEMSRGSGTFTEAAWDFLVKKANKLRGE